MILIPYDKFTVESKLSFNFIKHRAENYTGVDNSIFNLSGKLKYKCNFSDNTFTIMRVVQGRNSFIPVIRGVLVEGNKYGSKIEITIRQHLLFIFFQVFIILLISFQLLKTGSFNMSHISIFVIPVLLYFFSLVMYKIEMLKDKEHLLKILRMK